MDTLTKAQLKAKILALKTRLRGEEAIDSVKEEIADTKEYVLANTRGETPADKSWWRDAGDQLDGIEQKLREKSQDALENLKDLIDRMQQKLDNKM